MAKLECEICGGRLIMSNDGILQCEACGSCYSKDWARTKVQEITGTVQVEGIATTESLLKRAQEYFYTRDFAKAIGYCNRVLDIDPSHSVAKEIQRLSVNQLEEDKKDSATAQKVNLFQVYDAVVTGIQQFGCAVQLVKSGQITHIHPSEISDPPPKRIADVISIGDSVRVTMIGGGASLFPPEEFIGYYLQYPSIDAMKESLMHMETKFPPRMIKQAEGELHRTRGCPDTSLSSDAIEERIEQCELLLAKALHDNPNCAIEIPVETGPMGTVADISAWKTKEMQAEAKRIWEMGQPAAEILNDSSKSYLFLRRLLDFISPNCFFNHSFKYKWSEHTTWFGEEEHIDSRLMHGKLAFAYRNLFVDDGKWVSFPFDLPDSETLNCWYKNYKNKNCFAGGSFSLWSAKSSICHCTPEQCRITNPQCPLCDMFNGK